MNSECPTGKICHATFTEARQAAKQLFKSRKQHLKRPRQIVSAYRCRTCQTFHIGNTTVDRARKAFRIRRNSIFENPEEI